MKKNYLLLASAALVAAASCVRMPQDEAAVSVNHENKGTGTLSVKVNQDFPATRGMSEFAEEHDYEKKINTLEILVFDKRTGDIHGYLKVPVTRDGTSEAASGQEQDMSGAVSGTLNVIAGEKDVWAVVNSKEDLSAVTDRDDFLKLPIVLENNSTDASEGFVMAGTTAGTVVVTAGGQADAEITVERFTSRIALVKVNNRLPAGYGELVISDVFLSNVVANQNLAGNAEIHDMYNEKGMVGESRIGFGVSGTCPLLTHYSSDIKVASGGSQTPNVCLYSYPNDDDANRTRIILTATIDEKDFYYPVEIPSLARNASYDVNVTISGFGVDDPDQKIEKGSIEFTVTPKEWDMGDAIEKDL